MLIYTLYIIFGTNLLTGGPTQIVVFLPILEFHRKGISNGVQTERNLRGRDFLNKHDPGDLEWPTRNKRERHEAGGAPTPTSVPSTLVGPPLLHQRTSSSYIYPRTPANIQEHHENLIPPRQPSVTKRSHLEAFFGAPPEGALITEGLYINSMASPVMCE